MHSAFTIAALLAVFCGVLQAEAAPDVNLANPEEIALKGNIRRASLSTALGPVELRWPRAVEQIFGRTPERAMADAAQAVSRAVRSGSFPARAQIFPGTWQIVFMDENLPETQIPQALISNCHPGWMTPPGNIYIVAQRAATFCGGQGVSSGVADARLAQVLIHEFGHAVEYRILEHQFARDRMRAEGFASWFEQYAAEYSNVIARGQIRDYYRSLARQSIAANPGAWAFRGGADDYARSSMIFSAIAARRGVSGIIDVYESMRLTGLDLMPAVKQQLGWDERKLSEEIARLL